MREERRFGPICALASLTALLLSTPGRAEHNSDPRARQILVEMERAAKAARALSYVYTQRLRIGDSVGPPSAIAVKYSGGRIYLHIIAGPKKGAEIIFIPGANQDRIKVHKGSFPDITVNLDPHGSLAMAGEHHPVEHTGFNYLAGMILGNVKHAEATGVGSLALKGAGALNSRAVDTVEIHLPWPVVPHVVQKGETIWKIAERYRMDPYVILNENGMTKFGSLSSGSTLRVPVYYASQIVLSVDRETHLPAQLEVYDGHRQLYEHLQWTQVVINPPLGPLDFDPGNPAYDF